MATYVDPKTGHDRDLGQDGANSNSSWLGIVALLILIGLGGWYFYDRSSSEKTINTPSTAVTSPSSPETGSTTAPKPTTP
jgi:hypothetical protein